MAKQEPGKERADRSECDRPFGIKRALKRSTRERPYAGPDSNFPDIASITSQGDIGISWKQSYFGCLLILHNPVEMNCSSCSLLSLPFLQIDFW